MQCVLCLIFYQKYEEKRKMDFHVDLQLYLYMVRRKGYKKKS